jgi:NAD(P)-dependent dehydrogenase (short-subunit alcohol dehydrogenase family)
VAEDLQVAVLTGAAGGIGVGVAQKLIDEGMAVVGVSRDPEKLKALEKTIGNPERFSTLAVDLLEDDAPTRVVDFAVQKWGRINFLINNAGIGKPTPVHETDDKTLDYFLDLMLRAPFRLIREALPHIPYGGGIVNVTSTYVILGGRRGGPYSAAKGGLWALTTHLAVEYGMRGIRSNCVAPGVIQTEMVGDRWYEERFQRVNADTTPYPRLGTVEDVAATIAFLCSPGAEFINGQQIVVDGGWSTTKFLSERMLTSKYLPPD